MNYLPKIIAIVGPTASGKTALAARLAEEFLGEIVSADSKQVYRGLDIGTAKEKNLSIPQHVIDIKEPGEKITVAEFQMLAYKTIDWLLAEGKLPIVTGGTGLYAESIIKGYIFGGPGGKDFKPRYDCLVLGIDIERSVLKERIAERTKLWLEQGILAEISDLLSKGISPEWLYDAGQPYRYFTRHLQGELALEEAISQTNHDLSEYVRRQYIWWRRFGEVEWVKTPAEAIARTREFLEQKSVINYDGAGESRAGKFTART